jgi:hypothetical protein
VLLGVLIAVFTEVHVNVPKFALHRSYDDLCQKRPELIGLINGRLRRQMSALQIALDKLADTGEVWEPAQRISVAIDLFTAVDRPDQYLATSTDEPYASLERTLLRAQRDKLKHADARRLLVFPVNSLFDGLKDITKRRIFHDVLAMHRGRAEASASKGATVQLRYVAKDVQWLRQELTPFVGNANPLVDYAVVGGDLVFGQSTSEEDPTAVRGRGFVYAGETYGSMYADAFNHLWRSETDHVYPLAQLEAYANLMDMRHAPNASTTVRTGQRGKAVFSETIRNIKDSKRWRAIDVASSTSDWFEKNEYARFQLASCESVAAGGSGERIFVLPRVLEQYRASAFIENVLEPQIRQGIKVRLVFSRNLLEPNLAAIDCIFNDSWGFYLCPGDSFREDDVTTDVNYIEPVMIRGYFDHLYKALAKAARPIDSHSLGGVGLTTILTRGF